MFEGPNLEIIPKREYCLRWSKACAGRDPAKKKTTGLGFALYSLWRLSRLVLKSRSRVDSSALLSTRDGRPLRRTGAPYSLSTLRPDAGLPE